MTIQAGWAAGQTIGCTLPSGATVPFQVPPGATAGQHYSLQGDTLLLPDIRPQVAGVATIIEPCLYDPTRLIVLSARFSII